MVSTEKLCLQWNDFKENITTSFKELRGDRDFTDVTLACEDGQQLELHKVVLASTSPFFMELLKKNKHPHPLIYMKGLKSRDLVAMVDFLYQGEASVLQENLDSFLALAQELRLKGLTGGADSTSEVKDEPLKETAYGQIRPLEVHTGQTFLTKKRNPDPRGPLDTTIALSNDVNIEALDQQIESMVTKSDISAGNNQGKMGSCNVCGKEGSYTNIKQHIEANHITGVSHSCDICGKNYRSRDSLRIHMSKMHSRNQQNVITGPERH